MVTSDLTAEVEIRPFHACALHSANRTVRSLWTMGHIPRSTERISSLPYKLPKWTRSLTEVVHIVSEYYTTCILYVL